MKTYTLYVPEPGDEFPRTRFDIVDVDGRHAGGLAFEEMLGQVVALCHPDLGGKPSYSMKTTDEWQREREERAKRLSAMCQPVPTTTTESPTT